MFSILDSTETCSHVDDTSDELPAPASEELPAPVSTSTSLLGDSSEDFGHTVGEKNDCY